MKLLSPQQGIYVDFETFPIKRRPHYPPEPVSMAIQWPGKKIQAFAWGHVNGGNNCTEREARRELLKVWRSGLPVWFHNAKFDLAVAHERWNLPRIDARRVHDTMLALFIYNPRAKTFQLKPSSELLLKEPPTERDRVVDWLVKHQPVVGVKLVAKLPKSKSKPKQGASVAYAGAYVAYAPFGIVKPYVCGDIRRTKKLAIFLWKELKSRGLMRAYDVERLLLAPITSMEREGVPVDVPRLRADVAKYQAAHAKVDAWLCKRTGAPKGTNWDSSDTLVKWLCSAGLATAEKLGKTKKGTKIASNKQAIKRGVSDPRVLVVLQYRSRLLASLRTFMEPWLRVATMPESKGRIFTDWRTTTTDEGGARTGRLSSSPNFQNLIKRKLFLFGKANDGKPNPYPKWWAKMGLPDLPWVRGYIMPLKGHVIVDRDYSQQELRILAHYTGGALLEAYLANVWLDTHAFVQEQVCRILGKHIEREPIKTTVFLIIYGGGLGKLAENLGCSVEEAEEIRSAVMQAVPGLRELQRELRKRGDEKLPIRTHAGRLYFVEPPKFVDGKLRTFGYKLLNLLIQGGAADCTKQALLNLWKAIRKKHPAWRILLTVHDEFVLSVPRREAALAHKVLEKAMRSVVFKVPMLSEGKTGPNWGALEPYDQKGVIVALRPKSKKVAQPQELRKAA